MTRKRFIKIQMSRGASRNRAKQLAAHYRGIEISYAKANVVERAKGSVLEFAWTLGRDAKSIREEMNQRLQEAVNTFGKSD